MLGGGGGGTTQQANMADMKCYYSLVCYYMYSYISLRQNLSDLHICLPQFAYIVDLRVIHDSVLGSQFHQQLGQVVEVPTNTERSTCKKSISRCSFRVEN